MNITNSPSALPGSCYFCGSGLRDWYIDTDQSVEFHGAMYICNICFEEMSLLADYIKPAKYLEMKIKLESSEMAVYELSKDNQLLKEAIDALGRAGYRTDDDGQPVRDGGIVLESVEVKDSRVPEGKGILEESLSGSTEPSNDKGLGTVRPDDPDREPQFNF